MKWYETVAALFMAGVAGLVVAFCFALALAPYAVILLVGFALCKYLGWL